MDFFVTDKSGRKMTLGMSERLKEIEPNTYEERFPFENELVFCYTKGSFNDCQAFKNKQDEDIQKYLEIKEISNA